MPDILYTTDQQIEKMRKELQMAKALEDSEDKTAKRRTRMKAVAKRIFFYGLVALLLFMLTSAVITKENGGVPSLFGYQLYVVESGSMSPTLKVGAVILSKQVKNPETLAVNDIVTFKNASGSIVTHRIIEVLPRKNGTVQYRTKGDNPINSPDLELLDSDRVMARFAAKVPFT